MFPLASRQPSHGVCAEAAGGVAAARGAAEAADPADPGAEEGGGGEPQHLAGSTAADGRTHGQGGQQEKHCRNH